MGRPERPLDDAGGPIAEFAQDLRTLRRLAGNPSYRELARTALFAPSVLSSAAAGYRLPTLPVTLALVAACGGDCEEWERRWRKISGTGGSATTAGDARDVGAPTERGADAEQPRPFPRAVSCLARPAQLPPGSGTFVGRRQALASASHFVRQSSAARVPLIIGGPVGIGKTAFALRLADDVCTEFPDGQLYANLAAGSTSGRWPDDIISDFLRALGVPAPLVPDDPLQRAGLYRSFLAQRRLFVLLEDAGDECQVRPFLGRAAHSQVVVTSRARLLGLEGVHRIDLETFPRQESTALIGKLIGAERVQAEYEAADALAELCEDLPLAVSIIGRKLAARPEWAIAKTVGLLADPLRLMDSLSVGDVNVRDRFASACERLSPAGRQALRHLGLGGAGWKSATDLAVAMAITVDSADELLESLVDAGLLTLAGVGGRYCMSTLATMFAVGEEDDTFPMPVPLASRRSQLAVFGSPGQAWPGLTGHA